MSGGGPPPVRASTNGSGPDPADGSKGDATVVENTKVDSPDAEAAGPVDAVPSSDGSAGAGRGNEIAAPADDQSFDDQTADDQPDGEQPTAAEQPDDQTGDVAADVAEPDGGPAFHEQPANDASATDAEPDVEPAAAD